MTDALEATLEIDDVEAPIEVLEYTGREAINEIFEFTLTIASRAPLDVDAFIAGRAVLRFMAGGEPLRSIEGVIAHCVDLFSTETDHSVYRVRLVPAVWRSTLVELIDIYLDMDIRALVEHKLGLVDLHLGEDFELRLSESYPEREFVVQYQENDLRFLSRQLEHEGISAFFEHRDGTEVLVLGDHNGAFSSIGEVAFRSRGEKLGVFELSHATGMIPSHYVQRDYNYRQPDRDITADIAVTGPGRAGGFYEYGAHFKSEEEAKRIATVRAQEHACRQRTLEGRSVAPQLRAGGAVTLTEHPRGDLELIVTMVEHRGTQGFYAKEGATYENRFEAIRPEETFRPKRVTPKPRITGLLTGMVESSSDSEYADVDDHGRYRVRFLFDTAAPGERQASRPVRMMQPHSGPGYGMHFPLRGGVEVLIAFVGGDPDRPIIAGTMPNPRTPSPVTQSNRERNVIRTGAGNEINIDDTDGEERIKLSTPRSGATLQLGAPNAPEDGGVLESTASVTSAGSGSVNQAGAFSSNLSMWNNLWGNHVATVAGKVMPLQVASYGLDVVRGTYGQLSSNFDAVMGVHDTAVHFHEKKVADAEEDLAKLTPASKTPEEELADKEAALDAAAEEAVGQLGVSWDGYALQTTSYEGADDTDVPLSAADQALIGEVLAGSKAPEDLTASERAMAIAVLEAEYEAIADTDPSRAAALQHRLTTLQKQDLVEKQAAVAALETWEAEERPLLEQQLAVLAKARDEADNKDEIEAQINALNDQIEAQQDALSDARTAARRARRQRDEGLDTLDDALQSAADDDTNLDLASYEQARDEHRVYRDAVDDVEEAQDDLERAKTGWEDAKAYKGSIDTIFAGLDTLVSVPYSWYLTWYGSGMGGYAAKCADIMISEARAQRVGDDPVRVIAAGVDDWSKRKATQEDAGPHRNAGFGPMSRLPWLEDDRAGTMTYDTNQNAEYFKVNMRGGGAGGIATIFKNPRRAALAAAVSVAFGPVVGPLIFQHLSKTAAFEEARNIQGSEKKAVLFGKESAFVGGQEYATISSGKNLVMTSNEQAVLHTRGDAEVVGIDSLYLGSGVAIDAKSRGRIDLLVTDRAGGDDVTQDGDVARISLGANPAQPAVPAPPAPFVAAAAGSMHGSILLETKDNAAAPARLSAIDLNGKDGRIKVDSAGQHPDASLRLECHQSGALQSYLELSETANTQSAKLFGGTFGLEADGGNAAFAKLTSGALEVKVTATEARLGAPDGGAQIAVTAGGATTVRGDTTLDLSAPNGLSLVTPSVNFGGAAIDQVNLTVQAGPVPQIASLKTLIQQAQTAGDQAANTAQQALDAVAKEATDRENAIDELQKNVAEELEKKQEKEL